MKAMNQQHDSQSDRALEALLARAKPRPAPPKLDEESIRRAVRAEWEDVTGRRQRRRRVAQFALAASVLIAVLATLNALRGPFDRGQVVEIARIEKQFGIIKVSGTEPAAARMIGSGQSVETAGDSGLALAWHDGGSLRIDQNTRVDIESADEIYLRSGRIYFDSMPTGIPSVVTKPDKARLTIRTNAGSVLHFGTQFIARTDGDELSVMVREGRVQVDGDGVSETATVGQELRLTRAGETSVHVVGITGGDWQWIERTSPSFALDNRPIIEFLNWVSRETGRPLLFASKSAEQTARTKELRGIADREPSVALRAYMPMTGLAWRIEGDMIVIDDGEANEPVDGT